MPEPIDDAAALLNGYIAGRLTPEEERTLFESASTEQELFDLLMEAEAVRDALSSPEQQNRIKIALESWDGQKTTTEDGVPELLRQETLSLVKESFLDTATSSHICFGDAAGPLHTPPPAQSSANRPHFSLSRTHFSFTLTCAAAAIILLVSTSLYQFREVGRGESRRGTPPNVTGDNYSESVKKGKEARGDRPMSTSRQLYSRRAGSMLVRRAPAGAEISVDGSAIGTVGPDGTLALDQIKPGNHMLTVKKESYRPLTLEITVVAGQPMHIDAPLQVLTGTVRVTIRPPGVQPVMAWRRQGEEGEHPFNGTTLSLTEGTYTILGHAKGYEDARATVEVVAGQNYAATLNFKAVAQGGPRTFLLSDVEKAGGWFSESNVLVRTGGNYVLLPVGTVPGTYSFTAMMMKGKHLDWVLAFIDTKNHVAYELSEDRLDRMEFVEGKKQNQAKRDLKVKMGQWIQVTVGVTANSIVISIQQEDNNYPEVDRFENLNGGFLNGNFGFRVLGKDRLVLGAFAFAGK
jgi:hypothetical protein